MATAAAPHKTFDTILTLDFGSQYTHLITRRLRELNIYSEMYPCTQKIADLEFKLKGIILSGGPYSVYEQGAPHVDPAVFDLDVPILGICYGLQEIAYRLSDDNVVAGKHREYGHSILKAQKVSGHVDRLFEGIEESFRVWMSHGDKLSKLPQDFHVVATSDNSEYAAIAHGSKPIYGLQFHPEVTHSENGEALLNHFAAKICGCKQNWTMSNFVEQEIARIREILGEKGQVIGAVSGGVDSTVASKLMQLAIGDRYHAVLVDNGLLRLNEAQIAKKSLTEGLGINLTVIDASEKFLSKLKGVTEPEKKRKIIGNTLIEVFLEKAKQIEKEAQDTPKAGNVEYLLQGTLYPDVIESISFKGQSATIKTHHNVGGLPEKMDLKLIEPLRELFKDEVRAMGTVLGLSDELVWRHPFPGPGLGVRILGEVTPERVAILQQADAIFIQEIRDAGQYRNISQSLAALDPTKSVGVAGDQRVYAYILLLRAVKTTDFMTADSYYFTEEFTKRVSTRIPNEVVGISRVAWDHTSKPPGTIEFE